MTQSHFGTLYGISAGPGDPELISLKGLNKLQSAPIVAFPAGVRESMGVAQRIITPWLRSHQTLLPLAFPMVQDLCQLTTAWHEAAQETLAYLRQGQDVAFVSEGDVSFYSTYTYLAQTIQQQCPEIQTFAIPGVCSPLAAVASLGIPLTIQRDRLAILPALYRLEDLEAALSWADVLVLMKVGSVYRQVWDYLKSFGLLAQSALVIQASLEAQKIYRDLRDYPDLDPPYFSLMIVTRSPMKF